MGDYTLEALEAHDFAETARAVNDHWEAGDKEAARAAVSDELLDEITVTGTPERAAETIERYAETTDGLVILPSKASSMSELEETLENIGALF
jgi:alkanesulfonate monooxygenase SsuD/methylene tetrahydromethanopterin reductase-like flavin-dependent oxidoreductase (luciferase family)